MKYIKKTVLILLVLSVCLTSVVSQAKYSIEEFGIDNIDVPEGYISCTRSECDPELDSILKSNGFTDLSLWNASVMTPGMFYVYACKANDMTKCMYLVCEELKPQKTKEGVEHKYASDYNLIETAEDKTEILKEINQASQTNSAQWVTTNSATPYVEYTAFSSGNYFHTYETIYCGNSIILRFSSESEFSESEIKMHNEIFSTLKNSVVYDKANADMRESPEEFYKKECENIKKEDEEARLRKVEKENNSGKNTRILWYIIGVLVALVIVFSIFLAVHKKRKKIIVLREHEVVTNDNDADKNQQ